MGAIKDEGIGAAKEAVGKLVGNDDLAREGEEQKQRGLEQDEHEHARTLGDSVIDMPETHEGNQPGDSPSGVAYRRH